MSTHASHIGTESRIRANVAGDGDLTVSGTIDGDVAVRGDINVDKSGGISGNVEAVQVNVEGMIRGTLKAQRAQLGPHARLTGALAAPAVSIHPSARVDARFDMPLALPREVGGNRR